MLFVRLLRTLAKGEGRKVGQTPAGRLGALCDITQGPILEEAEGRFKKCIYFIFVFSCSHLAL